MLLFLFDGSNKTRKSFLPKEIRSANTYSEDNLAETDSFRGEMWSLRKEL